jgi:hypothetical protein
MRAEPFDPSALVAAARLQHADKPWLADALARCTEVYPEGRAYLYAVRPSGAVRVLETVTLHDRRLGTVVVDVLEGRRISGLEFLNKL